MAYRVPPSCLDGFLLIDMNIARGWSRTRIADHAKQYRLVLPLELLVEALTHEKEETCPQVLGKFHGVRIVFTEELKRHIAWECINGEPVGLLLDHEFCPGMPERSASVRLEQLLNPESNNSWNKARERASMRDSEHESLYKRFIGEYLRANQGAEKIPPGLHGTTPSLQALASAVSG